MKGMTKSCKRMPQNVFIQALSADYALIMICPMPNRTAITLAKQKFTSDSEAEVRRRSFAG